MSVKSKSLESDENPILDGLMKRRTVVLSGSINQEMIGDLWRRMLTLQFESSDLITLIIDSGGGNSQDANKLCDLMETVLKAPVRGVVTGMCGSSATFVLLHCKERLGTLHSRYVIHSGRISNISVPIDGGVSKHLEQLLAETRAHEELVVSMYMRKLKKTKRQVMELINRGDQTFNNEMSVTEAMKVGLVEKVVHQNLDLFP